MVAAFVRAAFLGVLLTLSYTWVVDYGGLELARSSFDRYWVWILDVAMEVSGAEAPAAEEKVPAHYIRAREVERIKWEPEDAFAAHLAELGRPVVLTNTVISKWPAVRNWRENSYLRSHAPTLPSVWNQSGAAGATFVPWRLVEEMPTRLVVESQRCEIRMHETSMARFLSTAAEHLAAEAAADAAAAAAVADASDAAAAPAAEAVGKGTKGATEYLYYTDDLSFFPRLDLDSSPRDFLKFRDRGIPNETHFDSQSMVWFAHPSVTAQPHYDLSHNFFAQVRSSKLIMLFSPEQSERLYFNPRLHPAHRQSQVDFDAPNLTRYPRFRGLTTLIVTLEPGELLYIPPFWAHRVESSADDVTISVSVISPSEIEARWGSINRKWPEQFEEDFKTPGSKIVAARILIETVLRAVLGLTPAGGGDDDVAEFMAALLETRYAPILPQLTPFMQLNPRKFKCLRSKAALHKRIEPKALAIAEPLAVHFARAIGGNGVSAAVRTILLRDYIEDTLASVVEPNDVPVLIANCWPAAVVEAKTSV